MRQFRRYGWKPDKPDFRDFLYKTIRPRILQIPESVDLRPKDSPIYNQGELGSCTGNSTAGAYRFIVPTFNPSRLFLYYGGRELEGDTDQDAGAEIRDVISAFSTNGVCSEEELPYDISTFSDRPSNGCYLDALAHRITSYHRLLTLDDMLQCLAEGFPFVFGFTVYEGFESEEVAQNGVVNLPTSQEKSLGGHAVCAVGYDKVTQRFIVRNSWGADWGQAGYFTIPFEYLQTLSDDFWTIRS